MAKRLFLLDGMALVYRAHFAFIRRPIFTSKGLNTSALFGFTQTLLDIATSQQPTHLAVAFDTAVPTQRHRDFPAYKAQREEMPEDIRLALPHVRRFLEAFNVPCITCDGFEADDIIGTLVKRAEREGFESWMVTPDKDFGQLVSDKTHILKPSRGGDGVELLRLADVLKDWGIARPEQLIDILGLWGDASDNIPGVPGIGEKTASKLIAQYGSLENLLAHAAELKEKLKASLEAHRDQALLSKRLATIVLDAPVAVALDDLKVQPRKDDELRALCVEFEFNFIGRRLFGEDFKAGRGQLAAAEAPSANASPSIALPPGRTQAGELDLFGHANDTEASPDGLAPGKAAAETRPNLSSITSVPHQYQLITTSADRAKLIAQLSHLDSFCFDTETTGLDPKEARLIGLAFSSAPHTGCYVAVPPEPAAASAVLNEFRPLFQNASIEKVGHNLKFDLSVLKWHGLDVRGRLFDTMIAHSLVEADQRHGMDYLSEVYLGYTPIPIEHLIGGKGPDQLNMAEVPVEQVAEYSAEDADVTWQLRGVLEPLLKEKGQERVFYDIEAPLIPVLVEMEHEGIRVDAAVLREFSEELARQIGTLEQTIQRLAGTAFNLNSPKQLGEILFDVLKIADKPKKTRTGQYATNEQTLQALAGEHEIVRRILDHRAATKLKSTYADTLPEAISPRTGRVHTTFNQVMTSTGRLASLNPNLQNIPIRTELGQEIRKAFVPRNGDFVLLSADYSQIELRVIAALSRDAAMLEAFGQGLDVHTATAAGVYGVPLDQVNAEMRRTAKMVNFGIIYGISSFGLAQRLGIPRQEAGAIIDQYFKRYPGIQRYLDDTIRLAKERGYVETMTGRRRYLRDIRSANATVRAAAERTAINTPIQGTAADMIKIAMVRIHRALQERGLKSRMLLQVHDELVLDLYRPEEAEVRTLIERCMAQAMSLDVPIVVEMGTGRNWLEAH